MEREGLEHETAVIWIRYDLMIDARSTIDMVRNEAWLPDNKRFQRMKPARELQVAD
ncbi:MAG TPA: hypothetical protein VMS89_00245 [Methanoregulaceae archaeon]|nr:hypothetical protein [Methanoregulaceae archaeon]